MVATLVEEGLENANYEIVDDYYGSDNDDGFNFGE
jgi:hypothetical protein